LCMPSSADMATLAQMAEQLARLEAEFRQAEGILLGGNLSGSSPLAPSPPQVPSPPQAPPPPAPPRTPFLIYNADDDNSWVLPATIGVAVLLIILAVFVCFGESLSKRVKISVLDSWANRPGPLMEENAPSHEPQALPEAMEDEARTKQQQVTQQDNHRQRLLEQMAGMSSVWGVAPAFSDGAASVDVDAATSAVGSLDAALLAAVTHGHKTMEVRALLLRGASPNAAFLDRCALALAARNCEPKVTEALLEAKAMLDKKDTLGWTPLMHAIDAHSLEHSREAVLMQLLDAGAAVDVWGHDMRGPLDLMVVKQQQLLSKKESSRASHITASKITMLMHQKSGSSGASSSRLQVPGQHGDPTLPSPRASIVSLRDRELSIVSTHREREISISFQDQHND